MIPFADFTYFGLLAIYIVVPTLLIRSARGFSRVWIVAATLFMLFVQYGDILGTEAVADGIALKKPLWDIPTIALLAGYALFQTIVALSLLSIRGRTNYRAAFYAAIVLALLPLAVVKFLPHWQPHTAFGFLGISYVTFRCIDVIIGIHDNLIKSLSPFQYLAYLFFFPTISSGPIDRYRRFATDWNRTRSRAEFLEDLDGAVHRIFNGFLLKFILAALVERYWTDPIDPAKHSEGAWNLISFMYGYSCYLYFDFAGYSSFAIGVSYLLGIRTPENFNHPYLAHNIRDFWNRWHITLTAFLRDHVFMRFLIAASKGRWFKNKYTPAYLGLFLSFGLMGLWHGTETYYLAYGLYHAALMAGFEVFSRWNKTHKLWGDGPLWRIAGTLITVQLVCMGFLLFSGRIGPY